MDARLPGVCVCGLFPFCLVFYREFQSSPPTFPRGGLCHKCFISGGQSHRWPFYPSLAPILLGVLSDGRSRRPFLSFSFQRLCRVCYGSLVPVRPKRHRVLSPSVSLVICGHASVLWQRDQQFFVGP